MRYALLASFLWWFSCAASLQAAPLRSFDQLLRSLKEGETVQAVIQYRQCRLVADSTEEEGPAAIGGMTLMPFEYFPANLFGNQRAFVAVSQSPLIHHPQHGYVINYVKMRLYSNNEVEIVARYLSPGTLEVKMDETFKGKINDGRSGGIYLYTD